MSKEIVNLHINKNNIFGRVVQHDVWLNQGVLNTSSPTFTNLTISGDTLINGNLFVEGNVSMLDTTVFETKDNIILLNNGETGNGVTLNQGGVEIDRGTLENFRFVYNELNSRFEVGLISNLKPVALREDAPLSNGIMVWNTSSTLIQSQNHIDIAIIFNDTKNSTSSTTGSIVNFGGIGIKKDAFIDGKIFLTGSNLPNYSTLYTDPGTNSLTITSSQDILLTPSQKIVLPFNKLLAFGNSSQSVSSNTSGVLTINSTSDINLTPNTGAKINIPNQIPLTFSTQNEKIYTDSSNNMNIAGSQDINLSPNNGSGGGGKKILIPVNTPLAFNNVNQNINSNLSNDLIINAGNNILLNPGSNLEIKIPSGNGIRFGGSGFQQIISNSNNELFIFSNGDLYLSPSTGSHININNQIPLTFGTYGNKIYGDTNGNLFINAVNNVNSLTQIYISNTTECTSASNGSIHTDGGLGVKKSIICEKRIHVNSDNSNAFQINDINSNSIFNVDTTNNGNVSIIAGDGTVNGVTLNLVGKSASNSNSLIQLQSIYDTTNGYLIGRSNNLLNNGRSLIVDVPLYSAYSNTGTRPKFSIVNSTTELFSVESETGNVMTLGTFGLSNTIDSTSPSTGALIIYGGLGVKKNIYTSGKYNSSVDNLNALQISNNIGNPIFNIDTINKINTFNGSLSLNVINNSAFKITNTTSTLLNIDTVTNNLTTVFQFIYNNTTNSNDTSTGSAIFNGGIAIQKVLNVGGVANFNTGINMLDTKIINVADPTDDTDVANKRYVNLIRQGLFVKDSVNVATTQSQNFATDFDAGSSIDNYTLILGDRILIKNQINSIENGIYIITNSTPTRSTDLGNGTSASGIFVFIKNGIINASLGFICNSLSPTDIIGTDAINFTEFTGLGQVTPGLGLSKNFNTLNTNTDEFSIGINNSNELYIKSNGIGTGLTGGNGNILQTTFDQSHVTKLGTINTGIWNGTVITVPYGGTGRSTFNTGNVLFGNGTNPINTDANLYYDSTTVRLGLGTNSPTTDIDIKSANTVTIKLNADSDANNSNAKPQIHFSYAGGVFNSFVGMTRNFNEYASNIYSNALVLSNNQSDTSSIIQFATNQQSRFTILSNGNIGINTSTSSSTLTINGTFTTNNIVTFTSTTISSNSSTASVIITGGLSINSTTNSSSVTNGGTITIRGGMSVLKDTYFGGVINSINGIIITNTTDAINSSTGSLINYGGITIKCSTDSVSITSGGGLLIEGGASIKKSVYIGSTLHALSDTYLKNLYIDSDNTFNFVESPNTSRDLNSFIPINFTLYSNTSANVLSVTNNGIITNSVQIGGTLLSNSLGNLYITPTVSNKFINVGTIGSYFNINLYGNNNGEINWQSTNSNLSFSNLTIQLLTLSSSGSVNILTPNTNGNVLINSSGANMTLNIGNGSNDNSQLTTILSNKLGTSTVTFTPDSTYSNLVLTNNVYSTFNGITNLAGITEYSGNALHQTINNTNGNQQWMYLGNVGSVGGSCEIDFVGGMKFQVTITGTTCTASHSHYGNLLFDSINKPICYIYKDPSLLNYQLFVLLASNSQTVINVLNQVNTKFLITNEGILSAPNGSTSNYTGSWTEEYTTQNESTLKYTTGDLTIEGTTFKIADNLPIIGYNNNTTNSSRNLGTLYQRYQSSNDNNLGDIVNDVPIYIDSIPSQSTIVSLSQIKFSNIASPIDNYYNNWWIKIVNGSNTNQVRQIVSYNGTLKVATLNTPFTTQNPSNGDTVDFYNNTFVINYYDEVNDTFKLAYTNTTDGNVNDTANLTVRSLYSTNTTVSSNSSTGSVIMLGGMSINNTSDAQSSTNGGSLTTRGGMGVKLNLMVGNNIGVGTSGFLPQESLHVRKNIATSRYENDIGSYSYIDFVENSTNNRFGFLSDNSTSLFSLTNSVSNANPYNSNKALTINSLGYIGINTTSNITSPLTIAVNNFISTNSTTGFLGLISGMSNINNNTIGSRILIHSNNDNINSGNVDIYGGYTSTTNGNINFYTNNDIKQVTIKNNGSTNFISTKVSTNSSTGALIVDGGLSINCSSNSVSVTNGGSFTTKGGISVLQDVYIGGNMHVNGTIVIAGGTTSPSLVFQNPINCTFVSYWNSNLIITGSYAVLTFAFSVTPSVSGLNTQIQLALPNLNTNLTTRLDVISSVSGFTDNTNVIPLFNTLCVGIIGTTNVQIMAQSCSTNLHYIQVSCTYLIA